jgi:myo-inositol-1(or 4)-monophosphatase
MIDLVRAARVAEQATYAAGTHLRASRSRLAAGLVTHQSPAEIAAQIEGESEALILQVLRRWCPEHGVMARTGGSLLREGQPMWVVNPLDGRDNYARGHPQYAVSIALVVEGESVVGAVYDPFHNEFFGAIRGHGVVLNGMPIHCSTPRSLLEALAATVFPAPLSQRMSQYMAEFGRVLRAFGGVRRSACVSLELACVAAGRVDAFWGVDLRSWDAAAGILLLRESGAVVEARDAEPLLLSRSLLACTPGLRGSFLDLLSPA